MKTVRMALCHTPSCCLRTRCCFHRRTVWCIRRPARELCLRPCSYPDFWDRQTPPHRHRISWGPGLSAGHRSFAGALLSRSAQSDQVPCSRMPRPRSRIDSARRHNRMARPPVGGLPSRRTCSSAYSMSVFMESCLLSQRMLTIPPQGRYRSQTTCQYDAACCEDHIRIQPLR